MKEDKKHGSEIFGIVKLLYSFRFSIICWGMFVFLISVVVNKYFISNIYTTEAKLLLTEKSNQRTGLLDSLSQANLPGFYALGSSSKNNLEVLKTYLYKWDSLRALVEEFDLINFYNVKSTAADPNEKLLIEIQAAINKLDSSLKIKKDQTTSIIEVKFTSTSKNLTGQLARAVVNRLVELSETKLSNELSKKTKFLEKRLAEAELELKDSEKQLHQFKKKNGIIQLDKQAEASIQSFSLFSKKAEETLFEYSLGANQGINSNHPKSLVLSRKMSEISTYLGFLREGIPEQHELKDLSTIYLPLDDVPDLELNLERLIRQKQVKLEVFTLLSQQYELARIELSKMENPLQVIQQARDPIFKSGPSRLFNVVVTTLFGVLLLCVVIILWKQD